MQNITVGRYDHESITKDYAGWIEGCRSDGSSWILWLDGEGSPAEFWGRREDSGAVIGEPVLLT
jgi:hypothetical protein